MRLDTPRPRQRLAAVAALLAGFAPLAPVAAAAQTTTLTLDASKTIGRIKPLRGVNGAPDLTFLPTDQQQTRVGPAMDISANYRAAHVDLVRTHDAEGVGDLDPHVAANPPPPPAPPPGAPAEMRGPSLAQMRAMDLNVLFPNLAADPEKAESYNFGPTDKMLETIHAIGAEVLFRLGREGRASTPPPTNLPLYASIIRHVVMHYNKGWANGYQNRVKYWEVWNEPDLGHVWWQGTPEQFYAFYEAAVKAVKAVDPTAKVGGPTIALVNEETPYREGFLAYARDHRLPLDFFSWHWYSVDAGDPYDFTVVARNLHGLLDRYGYGKAESFLDEWNADFTKLRVTPPMEQAAFVTSARIYMQDAPIDRDGFYRADSELRGTPTKVGQALIATGKFADTPQRLAVTGADTNGLAALAGRSADGRTIQLLVSNYEISPANRIPRKGPDEMRVPGLFTMHLVPHRTVTYPPRGDYRVALNGLGAGKWKVDHYRLDDGHDLTLVDSREVGGAGAALTGRIAAPMVDLFVLTRR